ncbi:putative secreted protein [Corynebacterium resistens DSM 45100]|uniref:Secreted protein n=2 Tax=Corynebacterium resistens TaxID=258224 RepID=F8DZA1_CORRG|nr:hypothetical protein [Corynebacterium resistens]AEI09787.1 putative secreted protein [Corynebacterium resistens DSM 45100]
MRLSPITTLSGESMPRRIFKSLLAAATVASLASGTATVATAQATTNTTAAAQDLSSTHTPTLSLENAGANTSSVMEGDTAYNNSILILGYVTAIGLVLAPIIALYNFGVSKGIVPPINLGR